MSKKVALLSLLIRCSGCAVRPNYKRPAVSVPGTYRGLTPEEAAKTQSASIGDQKWWDIFQDEQLRSLIRTALQQNYDVRIAASRVLAARAQLGIVRSDQFPNVAAGAAIGDTRTARSAFLPAFERSTDRKSTRLNSSHLVISYAVFCLKKKKKTRANSVTSSQNSRFFTNNFDP